jgi:cytochrome c oxidase subunit 1
MSPVRYALSVNPPATVPPLLNGFAFWNVMLLALVLIAYGYPVGQFFFLRNQNAPAHSLTQEVER